MELNMYMSLNELDEYCEDNEDTVVKQDYFGYIVIVQTISTPLEYFNEVIIYSIDENKKHSVDETVKAFVRIATLRCDKTDIGETDEYGDIMFSNVPAFYMAEHFIGFINKFYITEKDVH